MWVDCFPGGGPGNRQNQLWSCYCHSWGNVCTHCTCIVKHIKVLQYTQLLNNITHTWCQHRKFWSLLFQVWGLSDLVCLRLWKSLARGWFRQLQPFPENILSSCNCGHDLVKSKGYFRKYFYCQPWKASTYQENVPFTPIYDITILIHDFLGSRIIANWIRIVLSIVRVGQTTANGGFQVSQQTQLKIYRRSRVITP